MLFVCGTVLYNRHHCCRETPMKLHISRRIFNANGIETRHIKQYKSLMKSFSACMQIYSWRSDVHDEVSLIYRASARFWAPRQAWNSQHSSHELSAFKMFPILATSHAFVSLYYLYSTKISRAEMLANTVKITLENQRFRRILRRKHGLAHRTNISH